MSDKDKSALADLARSEGWKNCMNHLGEPDFPAFDIHWDHFPGVNAPLWPRPGSLLVMRNWTPESERARKHFAPGHGSFWIATQYFAELNDQEMHQIFLPLNGADDNFNCPAFATWADLDSLRLTPVFFWSAPAP
tara:strand:- start:1362 stop:1766 length:405 start_codon:yes stop_codon:yes gene_type:complete